MSFAVFQYNRVPSIIMMIAKAARSMLLSRYHGIPDTEFPMSSDIMKNAIPSMTAQMIPPNRFSHNNVFILFEAILVNIKKTADESGLLTSLFRAACGLPAVSFVGGVIEL